MFVGHEFLAFALVAGLAALAGRDRRTTLWLGAVAAAAAVLPDLDLLVGVLSYVRQLGGDAVVSMNGFWGVSNAVHRRVTHPLAVVGPAAVGVAAAGGAWRAWTDGDHGRGVLAAGVTALAVAPAFLVGDGVAGLRGTFVAGVFAVGVVAVGVAVAARTRLSASDRLAAAAGGLLSHPWGDVLMSTPPPLFAPTDARLLGDRLVFAADPTLNLLAITFVELTTVWVGLAVYTHVAGRSLRRAVAPRAVVGVGYAAAVVLLPRPTMVDAHWLGFTIAPMALVGLPALRAQTTPVDRRLRALVTGVATLTLAAAAYLLAYTLGGG
ncbi:metal-dependent hydrolase [Halobaculum sp. MBLA0143]|uniref:metal-dependent hydrolase n=1 Tax=Halobaculum sp. MBLA0143 TaxID=3079933 RepID=UPI0035241956